MPQSICNNLIGYINRSRLNEALRGAGYDIDGERYPEGYQEAPLAYDAVWSVALGNISLLFVKYNELCVSWP